MVGNVTQSQQEPFVATEAIEAWLDSLSGAISDSDLVWLGEVCAFAHSAYEGRTRPSGECYLRHALEVARILSGLHMDPEALAAALLHEVVEHSGVTSEELVQRFGVSVSGLVGGVMRITGIAGRRLGDDAAELAQQAEGLRRLLLAVVEDVRVVLIKLADSLDNARRLASFPEDQARRLAWDIRHIYAPLANRLGIWQIKWELEDLAFRFLEPEAYRKLATLLDERRADREAYIKQVINALGQELARAGIRAEITGRPKHIYSIWRKMQRKSIGFDQLFDVRAVRVLVPDVPACYATLGMVHSLWHHIPGEFDDYIANPKDNLYQSLHTAVLGPSGKTLEVQIRSYEMHQHAELGVAAHWRYKERSRYDRSIEKRIAWLRKLLESRSAANDPAEFIGHFETETGHDHVYVFTPKGEVMDLTQGATALDFAYAIHSDVGHRCRGTKVDGQIVPLTYELKNGETVEVLLGKESAPSRNWLSPHLGYLKTARARAKVRHWFNQQEQGENVRIGRTVLERELSRLNISNYDFHKLLARFRVRSQDELFAALGRGEISSSQVAGALSDQVLPIAEPVVQPLKASVACQGKKDDDIQIDGVGNLLVHMAGCCKPVPHDPIIGYITRGRGVTIHRRDCPSILAIDDDNHERLIQVQWSSGTDKTYPVDIQVRSYDRQGLLRDITTVLSQERVNVIGMHTESHKKHNTAELLLRLEIGSVEQLSRILEKIGQLDNVINACRSRS